MHMVDFAADLFGIDEPAAVVANVADGLIERWKMVVRSPAQVCVAQRVGAGHV
jgi:hypothetical protein